MKNIEYNGFYKTDFKKVKRGRLMAYKTIIDIGNCEVIEKKSRFLGVAYPAQTVEEAHEIIEKIKKEHYNARHNLYAYKIDDVVKYTDDKEPEGVRSQKSRFIDLVLSAVYAPPRLGIYLLTALTARPPNLTYRERPVMVDRKMM